MANDLDYKPNSKRYKEDKAEVEKRKAEKVVSGKVKTKKKGEMRKFKDVFISEDASNVKSYIIMDVLIPAAKKAISDIVRDGIDMILYGEPKGRKSGTSASYVSYRSYSDRDRHDYRERDRKYRASYQPDDIILETRGEAEDVLLRMNEIIDNYEVVSIADLNDLVGIRGQYTDNRYGWSNIRNARVTHVRDGYLLELPRATVID